MSRNGKVEPSSSLINYFDYLIDDKNPRTLIGIGSFPNTNMYASMIGANRVSKNGPCSILVKGPYKGTEVIKPTDPFWGY